ncbi:unnamed protein product [Closterium sp. Naga37s-1]|nr:unnamed protein product [Closterium sp. Naga37s-1]
MAIARSHVVSRPAAGARYGSSPDLLAASLQQSFRYARLWTAFQQFFGFFAFLLTLWFVTSRPWHSADSRAANSAANAGATSRLGGNSGSGFTGGGSAGGGGGKLTGPAAYVVVVCDESQLKSAMVLVHSIRSTKTEHDIVVLARNLSGTPRHIFRALGATVNPLPRGVPASVLALLDDPFRPVAASAHGNQSSAHAAAAGGASADPFSGSFSANPAAEFSPPFPPTTFADPFSFSSVYSPPPHPAALAECLPFKFSMWLLRQYSKVVYLDPRMLVLENIDDVLARPEPTAAPDNSLPDRFNPSLLVLEPSVATYRQLVAEYAAIAFGDADSDSDSARRTLAAGDSDQAHPQQERQQRHNEQQQQQWNLQRRLRRGPVLPVGSEDLIFFNHFFSDWPQLGAQHHLDYGCNAPSRLGYSATWNEWVHPKLKVVRFAGGFERWDELTDKLYPPTRRYDHLRWELLRDMSGLLVQHGVIAPGDALPSPLCQTDFMQYARGAPVPRKLSVVILTGGDLTTLQTLIFHFAAMRFVHMIYVMAKPSEAPGGGSAAGAAGVGGESSGGFNLGGSSGGNTGSSSSGGSAWAQGHTQSILAAAIESWNASKPVELLPPLRRYSMSARMRPIASLPTDCVLMCDDSVMVGASVLSSAFKFWQEQPQRLVGFFPSAHYRDPHTSELVFVADPREEYSMVGARLLLLHADYLQSYTCTLPQQVRDYIEMSPQCGDAALNFLAAELTGAAPLLVVDPDKRVTEDLASSFEDHTRVGSACLNDLEAFFGDMPLRNSTLAKFHLEQDTFTKMQLQWEALFDATKMSSSDENFRFMPSLRRVTNMPEVHVFPSPQHPKQILCILGNLSTPLCFSGGACNNSFAIATFDSIPPCALMLLGTSLLLHSRYGFDDRFHTPNILANLFYPYPDYSFMRPARAFFYRRGGLDMRLSPWSRLLFKAILGAHIAPFRVRNGTRPVCFERAVMTRRYRPAAQERSIVLQDVQERAWAYCSLAASSIPPSSTDAAAAAAAGNSTAGAGAPQQHPMAGVPPGLRGFVSSDAHTIRVLVLYGDADSGGYGMMENLQAVLKGLRDRCHKATACELVAVREANFTNFCAQVLFMGAASMLVTVSGDGTMNHVMWMRPGSAVLELVPFGIPEYDPRVLRVYEEASRWVRVEHDKVFELMGPECPRKNASCRFMYRRRAIVANVTAVMAWFDATYSRMRTEGKEGTLGGRYGGRI